MSTLRTTTLKHGGSTILDNLVLSNAGETRFCPNSSFGRAALYVDGQTNRVGVNTESPGVALDVDGAISATGNVTFGGTLTVTGTVIFNGNINADGRFLTIGGMQVTSNLTPTTGAGWELFRSSGGFAQMQAYDRGGNALIEGRIHTANWRLGEDGESYFLGKVGIGTTSPEEILHIAAASETVNQREGVMIQSTSALAADTGLPIVFTSNVGTQTNYGVASIAGRKENGSSGDAAGYLQFATGNSSGAISEKIRIDSLGNLLVGTTDSNYQLAVHSNSGNVAAFRRYVADGATVVIASARGSKTAPAALSTSDFGGVLTFEGHTGTSFSRLAWVGSRCEGVPQEGNSPGALVFHTTPVNGNTPTERARIDSGGRLSVGTTAANTLEGGIESGTAGVVGTTTTLDLQDGAPGFMSRLAGNNDPNQIIGHWFNHGGLNAGIGSTREVTSQWGTDLRFYTHKSTVADQFEVYERVRIYADGGMRNGTNIIDDGGNGAGEYFSSGGFIGINNFTFSTSAICFRVRTGSPTMTDRMYIRNDGDLENSSGRYTQISDARLKENIVDANSQWDDLKAIRIRNWNFKEETSFGTHRQIGPVAQELEQVCPGLVLDRAVCDENGVPTNETRKTVANSVLYMKAVKALQEAMERIETLEAKVAALESE